MKCWMKEKRRNFIKILKKHKEDALEYVVEQYLPIVKMIVVKSLQSQNNPGLMEECINDVFLAVWHNIDQFEGEPEDFRKWIAVIAKYKATDAFRKAIISPEVQVEDNFIPIQDSNYTALKKEEQFLHYLSGLGEVDRTIFIMKYYLEIKNGEIVKQLELSIQAIENRLYRGETKTKNEMNVHKRGGH